MEGQQKLSRNAPPDGDPSHAATISTATGPERIGSVSEAAVLAVDRYADGLAGAFPSGGVHLSPVVRAAATIFLGALALGVALWWARDVPPLALSRRPW